MFVLWSVVFSLTSSCDYISSRLLKDDGIIVTGKVGEILVGDHTAKIIISARGEEQVHMLNTIDSIVTDPPYGYSFMGKDWDKAVPSVELWEECLRVLKPGGRYLCLEFSKIQNENLNSIYKNYSKLIPTIGKFIVGEKEPYEYLIKSIDEFINQDELIDLMKKNGFQKCNYRNLSGGIVSIHSGWKI